MIKTLPVFSMKHLSEYLLIFLSLPSLCYRDLKKKLMNWWFGWKKELWLDWKFRMWGIYNIVGAINMAFLPVTLWRWHGRVTLNHLSLISSNQHSCIHHFLTVLYCFCKAQEETYLLSQRVSLISSDEQLKKSNVYDQPSYNLDILKLRVL